MRSFMKVYFGGASFGGILLVVICWVTSCEHNDNRDQKSSFPEVEHFIKT